MEVHLWSDAPNPTRLDKKNVEHLALHRST